MSVHYEKHGDKYVVRWREDGKNLPLSNQCSPAPWRSPRYRS